MKLRLANTAARTGYLLIECLVYMSVFVVVLGLGIGAFYVCLDHSNALHAGERWRADIRQATGTIMGEAVPGGEQLRIPRGADDIIYTFSAGEIRRRMGASSFSELLLAQVKASQMVRDQRGPVIAWRWELELLPRRRETRLPLAFSFEAATRLTP